MTDPSSVIVTGAASGMGAAHALLLSERGYHVHAADIQPLDETVEQVTTRGGAVTPHHLDVADPSSWAELVARAAEGEHPVRGLVNNAGLVSRTGISETTDHEWRRVLAVNLDGVFYGLRAVAPVIAGNGGGSIVNISSVGGLTGYHAAAYGASKWAVRGLTKTAAAEFAADGVRVNSVHPGLVETPLLAGAAPDYVASHLRSIPAGRAGMPEEVSRLIAFLLSDESTYITGSEFVIDGGFSAAGLYYRVRREMAD